MNLANGLTLLRIILVPLIVWLIISGRLETAFILFLLAGVSDAADGFLAKNFGWRTEVGAYLDPVADKALLVSIYVTLGFFGYLPAWLVIAAVSRDISIVGAFMLSWMLGRAVAVRPLLVSKANTLAQIVLAALVLAEAGFGLGLRGLVDMFIWVTGALIILSAAAYFWAWLKHMTEYEVPKPVTEGRKPSLRVERGERPRASAQ